MFSLLISKFGIHPTVSECVDAFEEWKMCFSATSRMWQKLYTLHANAGFVSSYPKDTPKHMNRRGENISDTILDLVLTVLLDGAY